MREGVGHPGQRLSVATEKSIGSWVRTEQFFITATMYLLFYEFYTNSI